MKTLTQFVENQNQWNAMFGKAPMQFPLSQKDVDNIARDLDCQLSPENLHCDGEISVAEANRKYIYLEKVYKDLEKYCLENWLTTPVVYEL
jgi:hypothetical protein